MTPSFAYIWEYRVAAEHRDQFLAAYNPDGDWAKLFASDTEYLGTRLLQDADDESRFATIDLWTSRAARDAFREEHADAFEALDRRCEAYTIEETFIGDFTNLSAAAANKAAKDL